MTAALPRLKVQPIPGGQPPPPPPEEEDAEGGPRQFVVVAAGGHWGFHSEAGADLGDALVAWALPRD